MSVYCLDRFFPAAYPALLWIFAPSSLRDTNLLPKATPHLDTLSKMIKHTFLEKVKGKLESKLMRGPRPVVVLKSVHVVPVS